jgi:hypothetical protein
MSAYRELSHEHRYSCPLLDEIGFVGFDKKLKREITVPFTTHCFMIRLLLNEGGERDKREPDEVLMCRSCSQLLHHLYGGESC